MHPHAELSFGYDALGIAEVARGGDNSQGVHGFWVSPDSGIYLDTTIGASLAAGVSGAVEAGAYVEGGMEATLALTLADQEHDEFDDDPEKIRLGLELGSDLFNVEGSIGGEIAFGIEAGVEINGKFVGYQVEHVLASGEIATFDTSIIPNPFDKTPAESVVLAEFHEATGVLHLYAGADAGLTICRSDRKP